MTVRAGFGIYYNRGELFSYRQFTRTVRLQLLRHQFSDNLLMTVGYVGNHGANEVLPIPFNQPGIATPSNRSMARSTPTDSPTRTGTCWSPYGRISTERATPVMRAFAFPTSAITPIRSSTRRREFQTITLCRCPLKRNCNQGAKNITSQPQYGSWHKSEEPATRATGRI